MMMEMITGKKVRVLTLQEYNAMLSRIKEPNIRALFIMSVETGKKHVYLLKDCPELHVPVIQVWNRKLKYLAKEAGVENPEQIQSKTLIFTHNAWKLAVETIRNEKEIFELLTGEKYEENDLVKLVEGRQEFRQPVEKTSVSCGSCGDVQKSLEHPRVYHCGITGKQVYHLRKKRLDCPKDV